MCSHCSWDSQGKSAEVDRLCFLGLQNHCGQQLQPWNLKTLALWKKSYDKPRMHAKKQRHYFADKGPYSQSYGFSNIYVWMWELDCKAGCVQNNWCFRAVVLGKTLESPLDCKEIKPVNPKGNQPWIFTGRTERLKAGGEGDQTGRDGWMASPTPWTWVWASSRRWWRTEKPGILQSMASQRVEHNWATEQQQNCMFFQATPEKDADPELRKSSNFNFAVWPKTGDLNISLTRLPDHQIVLTIESDCKEWMKLCLRSTGKYYENA